MSRKIVLIGLPTSGKSKTAGILAQSLGCSWVDTDLVIEQTFGHKVSWFFQQLGEEGFRALEYQIVAQALAGSAQVVSVGGGAPTYPPTRELLRDHSVYYLNAAPDYLADRQEKRSAKSGSKKCGQVRPLLAGDIRQRFHELYEARHQIYLDVATCVVDAEQRRNDTAADIVAHEKAAGDNIWVSAPRGSYPVNFGTDLVSQVSAMIPPRCGKVFIVCAPPMLSSGEALAKQLRTQQIDSQVHKLPDGEAAKQLEVLCDLWQHLADAKIERHDLMVSIGGGATTDLAGFAAATWLRGIEIIHVPTTLLAMVDASIGGKTGIDWTNGKNMVGSFYPPRGVVVDYTTLASLSEAHLREGLAEAIKCGFIQDTKILDLVSDTGEALVDAASPALRQVIRRAVAVKAEIVSADLFESSRREHLNFGHTLAHAIEKATGYRCSHGQAVAFGMVYAAHLGVLCGVSPVDVPYRVVSSLQQVGLQDTFKDCSFSTLKPLMFSDKKVRGGQLRFVVLRELAQPDVISVSDEALLNRAAELMGIPL